MAKKIKSKSKSKDKAADATAAPPAAETAPLVIGDEKAAFDPTLASLFANSAGPVKAPEIVTSRRSLQDDEAPNGTKESSKSHRKASSTKPVNQDDEQDEQSTASDEEMQDVNDEASEEDHDTKPATVEKTRKRKRGAAEDTLEDSYMKKLAKEEEKELKKRSEEKKAKRQKKGDTEDSENEHSSPDSDIDEDEDEDDDDASERLASPPPIHESLATDNPESAALERATRTIFLGNVSTDAIKSKSAKKTLLAHLSSFLPSLSSSGSTVTAHKIESIRFRSTAFASSAVPKRAAFAKKELMDATTRSTNAYVVYTTALAAHKALSLNGTVVLDRHLRVDSVAHPSVIDNKRCVFVGNLGFVDEQTPTPSTDPKSDSDKKQPKKKSSDIEEGLWRIFNEHCTTAGANSVESVRVIRDPTTRVGKGFAYVQFRDQNGVEAALLLDGKRFPPMLPRTLRVVRAKKPSKKSGSGQGNGANRTRLGGAGNGGGGVDPNLKGRAAKLLGRAGAVQVRAGASSSAIGTTAGTGTGTGTTPFVFEGYRATEKKDGGSGLGFKLKNKSKGKGRGRPKTRSANRAKAYRDAKKSGSK